MSGVISESYLSRPFTLSVSGQAGRELIYDVIGTNDEESVRTLLEATAPAAYLGRMIDGFEVDPVGEYVWKARARYIRYIDDSQYTFSTSGGTAHITQSIATVNSYAPPGKTPSDYQSAINVTNDSIEGTDITVPVYTWSETYRFSDTFVTGTGYQRTLFQLTGGVNNGSYKGLNAGEALFLGASGQKRGLEIGTESQWEITFNFAGSQNVSGVSIGPDITGVSKRGWDFLWIRYQETEDTTAKALIKKPIAVYVEQVYQYVNFGLLNIGT